MLGLATTASNGPLPIPWLIGLGVVAVLALYVAYKLGRFLMKLVLAVLVLAALAGAVWWFWLRQ